MALYVDPHGQVWADTDAEINQLAKAFGLPIQRDNWIHVDSNTLQAIQAGAILTDHYGPIRHCTALDLKSDDPEIRARGYRRADALRRLSDVMLFQPLQAWELRR